MRPLIAESSRVATEYASARLDCSLVCSHAAPAATDQIVTEAVSKAKETNPEGLGLLGREPTALVVWDSESRGEKDLTAKFAALAANSAISRVGVLLVYWGPG